MNDLLIYSFTDNAWETVETSGEKPEVRSGHAAVVFGG